MYINVHVLLCIKDRQDSLESDSSQRPSLSPSPAPTNCKRAWILAATSHWVFLPQPSMFINIPLAN